MDLGSPTFKKAGKRTDFHQCRVLLRPQKNRKWNTFVGLNIFWAKYWGQDPEDLIRHSEFPQQTCNCSKSRRGVDVSLTRFSIDASDFQWRKFGRLSRTPELLEWKCQQTTRPPLLCRILVSREISQLLVLPTKLQKLPMEPRNVWFENETWEIVIAIKRSFRVKKATIDLDVDALMNVKVL